MVLFLSFSFLAHVFKQSEEKSDKEHDIPGVLYIDGEPVDSMTDYKYNRRVGHFTKDGITYYGLFVNSITFAWIEVSFDIALDAGYSFSKKATCDMENFFEPSQNPDNDAAGIAVYNPIGNGMTDSGWAFIVFFETPEGALNSQSICQELESKLDTSIKYADPLVPEGPGAE